MIRGVKLVEGKTFQKADLLLEAYYNNEWKVYDLNTLCNLCPEILKILNSPFDTAFERGADGKLHKINMEDEG